MTEEIESFSAMLRRALGDRISADAISFIEMMAEDGIMEFPFAPVGLPTQVEGREAIGSHLAVVGGWLEFDRIGEATVHTTADPGVAILEFEGYGRGISTGEPYEQRYISVIRTRDGRIAYYRDYWNPLALLSAIKGAEIAPAIAVERYGHD